MRYAWDSSGYLARGDFLADAADLDLGEMSDDELAAAYLVAQELESLRLVIPLDHWMRVTQIVVHPLSVGSQRATATLVLDGKFVVRRIRISQSRDKAYHVELTGRRPQDGNYMDVASPVSREFMAYLSELILAEYLKLVGEPEVSGNPAGSEATGKAADPDLPPGR